MSMNPVFAAALGAVVLAERLGPLEWGAIALIVTANAGAILAVQLRRRPADVHVADVAVESAVLR